MSSDAMAFIRTAMRRAGRFMRRSPLAAGIPFMAAVVAASYGLSFITQTKYDYIDQRYKAIEKRRELGYDDGHEALDIRQIYFDLYKSGRNDDDDWDFVRLPRPGEEPQERTSSRRRSR